MGLHRDLQLNQTYLLIFAGVVSVITMTLLGYYPLTKQYEFTYFATPATYGVLSSDRFNTLDWWITALYVLPIFVCFWTGVMLVFWDTRGYKIFMIVYLSILLMWFITVFIIQTIFLATKNDPSAGNLNNPANSYRACCTPEFYLSVTQCPNYGSPAPECNPSISLSELGANGDFVMAYCWTIAYMGLLSVMLYLTVRFMQLREQYEKARGDEKLREVTIKGNGDLGAGGSMLLTQNPIQSQLPSNPVPMIPVSGNAPPKLVVGSSLYAYQPFDKTK